MSESIQERLRDLQVTDLAGEEFEDAASIIGKEAADYIDKLEAVLAFYADPATYETPYVFGPMAKDQGKRAREALGEDK